MHRTHPMQKRLRRLGSRALVAATLFTLSAGHALAGMSEEQARSVLLDPKAESAARRDAVQQIMTFNTPSGISLLTARIQSQADTPLQAVIVQALVQRDQIPPVQMLPALLALAEAEGLGLEAIGLATNPRGQIETGHDFRTSVPSVWAIGDVIPGPMLAHKAEDEGIAVAENIAGLTGIINHAVIPGVVYTMPEFAGVGLTEEAAKERGAIKVGKFPMMANSRAKTNREGDGFVKVIADAETDRVLGVWCIASLAGTMIAQAAQAMEFGATSEDIAYTCHAHPTHSEAMKEAAMAVMGKPIHI